MLSIGMLLRPGMTAGFEVSSYGFSGHDLRADGPAAVAGCVEGLHRVWYATTPVEPIGPEAVRGRCASTVMMERWWSRRRHLVGIFGVVPGPAGKLLPGVANMTCAQMELDSSICGEFPEGLHQCGSRMAPQWNLLMTLYQVPGFDEENPRFRRRPSGSDSRRLQGLLPLAPPAAARAALVNGLAAAPNFANGCSAEFTPRTGWMPFAPACAIDERGVRYARARRRRLPRVDGVHLHAIGAS